MHPIPAHEIQSAVNAYARLGNYIAVANELGLTKSGVQRRIQIAKSKGVKPRYRINTAGDVRDATNQSDYIKPPAPKPEALYSPDEPETNSTKEIRVLAIGDAHDDPYLSKDRFKWIGKYAADQFPDRIVQIGDIADFESLSFHSRNDTFSGRYKPLFLADMESLDQALDALMEPIGASGAKARFDLTLGNHENRIWRFEDGAPETSGMLQLEFSTKMKRYGINYHQYGKFLDIGGVQFTHAPFSVMGKPIGGMTGSQTVARQSVSDMVSGHTHKGQMVTQPKLGEGNRVTVIDLGCALPWKHIQSYAKHTMTGWWWGVWMLTIKDGRIQGHEAIPMYRLQAMYG